MLGLRTTIYKVGDIQKATAWYAKAFETKPYFNELFYVGFIIGGYELGLQPEENPTDHKADSVVSYWGVDDIQKEYERLIGLGATENKKPYHVGEEIMTATLKDPFGNVIGLIYKPALSIKRSDLGFFDLLWSEKKTKYGGKKGVLQPTIESLNHFKN